MLSVDFERIFTNFIDGAVAQASWFHIVKLSACLLIYMIFNLFPNIYGQVFRFWNSGYFRCGWATGRSSLRCRCHCRGDTIQGIRRCFGTRRSFGRIRRNQPAPLSAVRLSTTAQDSSHAARLEGSNASEERASGQICRHRSDPKTPDRLDVGHCLSSREVARQRPDFYLRCNVRFRRREWGWRE